MLCPRCGGEFAEQFTRCPNCDVRLTDRITQDGLDFDVLIRTSLSDTVAISLAISLFEEAGIPFFAMDQSLVPRQESGNWLGWWNVRVPSCREAEAREILESVMQASRLPSTRELPL